MCSVRWLFRWRLLAAAMFLAALLTGTAAQKYSIKHFTMQDGLPHDYVHAILQTSDGYLWFATRGGLVRYDGRKMKVWTRANQPAFVNDGCICLAEDMVDGSLWVGTGDGLLRVKDGVFRRYTEKDGLSGQKAWVLSPIKTGGVWAQMISPSRIDLDGKAQSYPESPDFFLFGKWLRLENAKGQVWFSNPNGIFLADPSTQTTNAIHISLPLMGLPTAVMQTPDGAIHWTTKNGLGRWQNNRGQFFTNSPGFTAIAATGSSIWLGGQGLYRFENEKFTSVLPEIFSSKVVECLAADNEGNVWIALNNDGGVYRLKEKPYFSLTTEDGLATNATLFMKRSRAGELHIGTASGLSSWDGKTLKTLASRNQMVDAMEQAAVHWSGFNGAVSLAHEMADGTICFSYYDLPFAFILVEDQVYYHPKFDFQFHSNCALQEGDDLWVSHNSYISHHTPEGTICYSGPNQIQEQTFRPDLIRGFFRDLRSIKEWRTNLFGGRYLGLLRSKGGALWIGSSQGIQILDNEKVHLINSKNGLPSDVALPLHEEADGTMWISTFSGLVRWKNQAGKVIGLAEGLTCGPVSAFFEDGFGYVWMGARQGVVRIRKQFLQAVADGAAPKITLELIGPPVNALTFPSACQTEDGELWFPSREGAIRFQPASLLLTNENPVQIERISIDGKDIPEPELPPLVAGKKQLRLKPGEGKVVRVDFTRCQFNESRKPHFRTRLAGHSDGWIVSEAGEPAQYIGLPPGEYRFEVQTDNDAGEWVSPRFFMLSMPPHFYQTTLFYVLLTLAGLGLVIGIHLARLRNSRKIMLLQEQNSLSRERERIAADIHDVLGSTLTRIGLQAEIVKRKLSPLDAEEPELQKLGKTVRDATTELDEVVWLFRSAEETLPDLAAHLEAYAESFLEGSGIRLYCSNEPLPEVLITIEARRALVLIVREAINNALKHAGASRINLAARFQDERFQLEVSDDGKGIPLSPPETRQNGFSIMRRRVEQLGGELVLDSSPEGTAIRLAFPLTSLRAKSKR